MKFRVSVILSVINFIELGEIILSSHIIYNQSIAISSSQLECYTLCLLHIFMHTILSFINFRAKTRYVQYKNNDILVSHFDIKPSLKILKNAIRYILNRFNRFSTK